MNIGAFVTAREATPQEYLEWQMRVQNSVLVPAI